MTADAELAAEAALDTDPDLAEAGALEQILTSPTWRISTEIPILPT